MGTPVLLIDDDLDVLTALRCALEYEGYTVYAAPDGQTALIQLREHSESVVVLLDVRMPGLGGIELFQLIQALPGVAGRHAYIVMTVLHDSLPPSFRRQLAELRIPILAKPFDLQRLLDAVQQASLQLSGVAPGVRGDL